MASGTLTAYAAGKETLVRDHEVRKTYARGADVTHALSGVTVEVLE